MYTKKTKSLIQRRKKFYSMLLCTYREEILYYVLDNPEKTVTEIYYHFKIKQAVASQALADLRGFDLVVGKRKGKNIHYSANRENVAELIGDNVKPVVDVEGLQIDKAHAAFNFWLFLRNASTHNLLKKVFAKEKDGYIQNLEYVLIEHCDYDLSLFISKLTEEDRGTFVSYVLKNYEGVTKSQIEKSYLNLG